MILSWEACLQQNPYCTRNWVGSFGKVRSSSEHEPSDGFSVRAPGQGDISVSEITKSNDAAAPNQPVRLSVDISGENIGYIYLFVGYYDSASNSIEVLATHFLESADTRQLNGVYYPIWGNDFTLSFNV